MSLYHDLNIKTNEGQKVEWFSLNDIKTLTIGPHHLKYLLKYISMDSIHKYFNISKLKDEKSYSELEVGEGFILSDFNAPTGAIHPKEEARFIALLEFVQDTPRGDHYHKRKVEYMIILNGKLHCKLTLAHNKNESTSFYLLPGQTLQIIPGCIHTYTAIGSNVKALEYSPNKFELSDVIKV